MRINFKGILKMGTKIFIGSSKEAIDIAHAIAENLYDDFEPVIWKHVDFELSESFLTGILNELDEFDFGIFVFSGDDEITIRKEKKIITRDNVIFELGLFIGRLGKKNNFLVVPNDIQEFHQLTDLSGITTVRYKTKNPGGNLQSNLSVASQRIKREILKAKKNIKTPKPHGPDIDTTTFKGVNKGQTWKVIAHCANPEKFNEMGILAPGIKIVKDIIQPSTDINIFLDKVKESSILQWGHYSGEDTIFIVDSPFYNPYLKWIIDNYCIHIAGGSIKFPTTSNLSSGPLIQKIFANSKIYGANKFKKINQMKVIDEYEDYLLIMRLPGFKQINDENVFDISNIDETKIIWVVAGIHSKASYAGACIFQDPNFKIFIDSLRHEINGEVPKYFEVVFKVPEKPSLVDHFSLLSQVHFSRLNLKAAICIADPMPTGIAYHFTNINADYNASKIPIHTVHFDPVASCNYMCPTCIESYSRKLNLFLSINTISKIFCDLKEQGCKRVNFYGGEPTLHPYFPTVLRLASNLNFEINLISNGSKLAEKEIKEAIKNVKNIHLRISLDATSQKNHSVNHGLNETQNDFDLIRNSIIELSQMGTSVTVSILLYKNCIDELEDAYAFWEKKNIASMHLRPLTSKHGKAPMLSYTPIEYHKIKKVIEESNGFVTTPNWFYKWLQNPGEVQTSKSYNKCYSAYYRIAISPWGNTERKNYKKEFTETDSAWISLCTYRRYEKKYGCEYPKDFNSWVEQDKSQIAEGINPNISDCKNIICCRDDINCQTEKEIFEILSQQAV